jgi:hypothetical protein
MLVHTDEQTLSWRSVTLLYIGGFKMAWVGIIDEVNKKFRDGCRRRPGVFVNNFYSN